MTMVKSLQSILNVAALELPEAGWSKGDGPKAELADHVVELFIVL
jgi:hypothetical protein